MASQEGEEGTCDCPSVQESLQILNEQPRVWPLAMLPLPLLIWWHLVSAGSTEPPGTPHHRADREQIVKVEKGEVLPEHCQEACWVAEIVASY